MFSNNFFSYFYKYKGRKVEVEVMNSSDKKIGVITSVLTGVGDNGAFLELDNKMLINLRYIIKFEIVD